MRFVLPVVAAGLGIGLVGCVAPRQGIVSNLPPPLVARPPAEPRPPQAFTSVPPASPTSPRVAPVPPASSSFPPSWMPRGGISNRWKSIVIHHSASAAGSASVFDAFHRNANHWDELGYHFVIGNGSNSGDGEIEVGSRWLKQKHGAHCKTADNFYNDHGIGICLVGDFQRQTPSPAQMNACTRLVRFLLERCRLPAENVVTHGGVTGKTLCPGARFSIGTLRRAVGPPATASVMR